MGVCGGIMGTGGGGGPGGVSVVLWRGGAQRVGAWAYADPWLRAHRLLFGVGLEPLGAAVAGHLLSMGRHRGLVSGRDAAVWPWHCSGQVGGDLWAWDAGFEWWRVGVRRDLAAARSAMKVVVAASVTVGGRRAGRCCCRVWDGCGQRS